MTAKRALQVVVMATPLARIAVGQGPTATGRSCQVEIVVLDQDGQLLMTETDVTASGPEFKERLKVQGRRTVELPCGSLRFEAVGRGGAAEKRVPLPQARSQVVLALSGRPQDDDEPWTIRGQVAPAPKVGETMIVRLLGLYVDLNSEAMVGSDGSFQLSTATVGPYKLWVLRGGKRVAERDVKVEPLPKELPFLRIEVGR